MPQRQYSKKQTKITQKNKLITLPVTTDAYNKLREEATAFRQWLDEMVKLYPELFPVGIVNGYTLHDVLPVSVKLVQVHANCGGLLGERRGQSSAPRHKSVGGGVMSGGPMKLAELVGARIGSGERCGKMGGDNKSHRSLVRVLSASSRECLRCQPHRPVAYFLLRCAAPG